MLCSHFLSPSAEMCVNVINKCCYVSAPVVQVSELMQQRSSVWMHNSSLSSTLSMPLVHFLAYIIFHDFQKAPHITHTNTHAYAHPRSFPGILEHNFLVLESFDLSDRTVRGDRKEKQKERELICPVRSVCACFSPLSNLTSNLILIRDCGTSWMDIPNMRTKQSETVTDSLRCGWFSNSTPDLTQDRNQAEPTWRS